ncbi:MAG TPA: hypothetical protein VHV49_15075, partial [Pseudonocardiaceae bacterium]|nr:hypothetical protein [Pseudonocardiaceae bacterium]
MGPLAAPWWRTLRHVSGIDRRAVQRRDHEPSVSGRSSSKVDLRYEWTSTARSGHLRGRKSRDTGPELALRRALHARGLRFRLQIALTPRCRVDIVLPRHVVAVFVDGCFWHGCPEHGTTRFG